MMQNDFPAFSLALSVAFLVPVRIWCWLNPLYYHLWIMMRPLEAEGSMLHSKLALFNAHVRLSPGRLTVCFTAPNDCKSDNAAVV